MAPKVLFVTPSNAPGGYFCSLNEATSTLQLVAVRADATIFPDHAAAAKQRASVMGATTPEGRHLALAVDIQDV